jgi:N-acetylmuramoyl-L-alanine amidase
MLAKVSYMVHRLLREKHVLIFFFLSLSLFFILFFNSFYRVAIANPHSAKILLTNAQKCTETLYQSKVKKKYRHNWERCIKRYEDIYKKLPKKDEAVRAMFAACQLWTNLYGYSGRNSDIDTAISLYRTLVDKYKTHRLADDAQYRLGLIFYRYKKDPKQAYVEFLKVEIQFPNGDAKIKAAKMMDELECLLGKKELEKGNIEKIKANNKKLILVTNIRHWSTPTYTRVVVDLENPVAYNKHLLKEDRDLRKPRRLFVDLQNSCISKKIESSILIKDGLLQRARAAQHDNHTVRVVLDIENMAGYRIFHLHDPFRIVIDVQGKEHKLESKERLSAKQSQERREIKQKKKEDISLAKQLGLRVRRIVIDAGHGGKDPGAIGRNGLREKDIVLTLANLVAKRVREDLHCQVILTRSSDVFLPLEKRTAIANMEKADLFISLHANAHKNSRYQGLETYILNMALDEDSMNVAARENATSAKNISDLQMILNDLMLNTKINESSRLAEFVHKNLVGEVREGYKTVNDRGVRQAPFYVLIGAEMPAILVEVGYITNAIENKRLESMAYLTRVSSGIVKGIDSYIKDMGLTYKGG